MTIHFLWRRWSCRPGCRLPVSDRWTLRIHIHIYFTSKLESFSSFHGDVMHLFCFHGNFSQDFKMLSSISSLLRCVMSPWESGVTALKCDRNTSVVPISPEERHHPPEREKIRDGRGEVQWLYTEQPRPTNQISAYCSQISKLHILIPFLHIVLHGPVVGGKNYRQTFFYPYGLGHKVPLTPPGGVL